MKIEEITQGSWLQCTNLDAKNSSDFKLHAALPIENFDTHAKRVYQLLKKAVEDGIIPAFKILK